MSGITRALRGPIIGGLISTAVFLLILWLVGRLGGYEARVLLESSLPTIRFLSSTTAGASATILALMLTLLSLSRSHDARFRASHYDQIKRISFFSTACLMLSILLLLVLVVPLQESGEVAGSWYRLLYYGIAVTASLLGGLMVAIMLMLYDTISGLISIEHPDEESELIDGGGKASR